LAPTKKSFDIFVNGVFKHKATRTNFGSKILCIKHNNELSPLDQEAKKLFDGLTTYLNSTSNEDFSIKIESSLIERWLLKTFINFNKSGISDSTKSVFRNASISDNMTKMVFGKVPFEGHSGAYLLSEYKGIPPTGYPVKLLSQEHSNKTIGMIFGFGPITFLLWTTYNASPIDNPQFQLSCEITKLPCCLVRKKRNENGKNLVLSFF